jgi:hypothetical protein
MIKEFIKKILGIKSPSKELRGEYHEKDTKCDICDRRSECEPYLLRSTHSYDTREHVIPGLGYICPLEWGCEDVR